MQTTENKQFVNAFKVNRWEQASSTHTIFLCLAEDIDRILYVPGAEDSDAECLMQPPSFEITAASINSTNVIKLTSSHDSHRTSGS